jgi:hypothetical protein
MGRPSDSSGSLYVEKLRTAGVILRNTFAFYLSDNKTQSFVTIGNYDIIYIKNNIDIVWLPLD